MGRRRARVDKDPHRHRLSARHQEPGRAGLFYALVQELPTREGGVLPLSPSCKKSRMALSRCWTRRPCAASSEASHGFHGYDLALAVAVPAFAPASEFVVGVHRAHAPLLARPVASLSRPLVPSSHLGMRERQRGRSCATVSMRQSPGLRQPGRLMIPVGRYSPFRSAIVKACRASD